MSTTTTNRAAYPWREVVETTEYRHRNAPFGSSTRVLKLACGHEMRRKGSQRVPERVRCTLCPQIETYVAAKKLGLLP